MAPLAAVLALAPVVAGPAQAQEASAGAADLDLHIVWDVDGPLPDAAHPLRYQVVNRGTEAATGVVMAVELPEGVALAAPNAECTAEGDVPRCQLGRIEPGDRWNSSLHLIFASVGGYPISATVTADQPGVGSSASTTAEIVEEEADLRGGHDTARVRAGSRLVVRHGFYNGGPTPATGMLVDGRFPAGVEVVPGTLRLGPTGGTRADDLCTVSDGGFRCGPLEGADLHGDTVQYDVVARDTGTFEAEAIVIGRADPEPINDSSFFIIEVVDLAYDLAFDLEAELRTSTTSVPPGATFPVEATVRNVGDGPTSHLEATLSVPQGWTVVGSRGSCTRVDPRTRRCRRYGNFDAGASWTTPLVVAAPAVPGTGTLTLEAVTTTHELGDDDGDDVAELKIAVVPAGADLMARSVTSAVESPQAGETDTVTARFRNASTERAADGVRLEAVLPEGVTPLSGTVDAPGGFAGDCRVDASARTVSCVPPGGFLAPGAEVGVDVEVRYEAPGRRQLTVTATQTSVEQAPGDESLPHVVEVARGIADIGVTSGATTREAAVGEAWSYRVVVDNLARPATGVVITDEVPEGLELVDARWGWLQVPCDVDVDVGAVSCELPDRGPYEERFVVVTVRADAAGTYTHTPTLTADQELEADEVPAPVTVEVVEPGDLSPVDLVVGDAQGRTGDLAVGRPVTIFHTITNRSPRVATDVSFRLASDAVPEGLELVDARFGYFDRPCTAAAEVTCEIPLIESGGQQLVIVELRPTRTGPLAWTASTTTDQPDADPASNTVLVERDVLTRVPDPVRPPAP